MKLYFYENDYEEKGLNNKVINIEKASKIDEYKYKIYTHFNLDTFDEDNCLYEYIIDQHRHYNDIFILEYGNKTYIVSTSFESICRRLGKILIYRRAHLMEQIKTIDYQLDKLLCYT